MFERSKFPQEQTNGFIAYISMLRLPRAFAEIVSELILS